MKIDLSNAKLSNVQFGDRSVMNISNTYTGKDDDWRKLQDILEKSRQDFAEDTEEGAMVRQALGFAQRKDSAGLRKYIKENKDNFFTGFFSNLASAGVMGILARLGMG